MGEVILSTCSDPRSVPGSAYLQKIYEFAETIFPPQVFHHALKATTAPVVWWLQLWGTQEDVTILNMKSWFAFLWLAINPFLPFIAVFSLTLSWIFSAMNCVWLADHIALILSHVVGVIFIGLCKRNSGGGKNVVKACGKVE